MADPEANVLIIDDEVPICKMLSKMIGRLGYGVDYRNTLEEGLCEIKEHPYDIVFLDVLMPDGNGLDLLPQIRETEACPEVIIITGFSDKNGAELAITNGAWDYIPKGSSYENIKLSLKRAVQYREQKRKKEPQFVLKRDRIVGSSPAIGKCLELVASAAQSEAGVLITGETGTGKELIARAIHENSSRAAESFVVVDCASLPETLVESVLFGHERGAFTGADTARKGLIQHADGGTLFMDEVGELPLSIQKAFLRVLQERRYRPIGSSREMESNFRLVCATNRNPENMVKEATFRKDLYFRIKMFEIELPPLRDRREDIFPIALEYMNRSCKRYDQDPKTFSPEFVEALTLYEWPGNVRELLNTIEMIMAETVDEPVLFSGHLPSHIRIHAARNKFNKSTQPKPAGMNKASDVPRGLPPMQDFIDQMKEQYLKELIALTDGNIKRACQVSGLSRSHLYQLLKDHNVRNSGK